MMIPIHRIIHLSPPLLLLLLLLATTTTTTIAQDEVTVQITNGSHDCEESAKITPGKFASIHYSASIDESSVSGTPGEEFDSSYDRRIPFNFQLGTTNLMKGLEMGVKGLCQGSEAIIVIPPAMGYGSHGLAPSDATIRFTIDVLDVSNVEIPKPDMVIPDPADEDDDENEFEDLDTDNDGRISKDELAAYYHSINHDDYGGRVFEYEDTDGDGFISWEEFHGKKGKAPPSTTVAHESMEVQLVSGPVPDPDDNEDDADQNVSTDDAEVVQDDYIDDYEDDEIEDDDDEENVDADVDSEIWSDDEWSYEDEEVNEFLIIDENADGNITKEEMVDYYKSIGHTDFDSIEEIFRIEDANEDGVISWSEFSGPKGDAPPVFNNTSWGGDADDGIFDVDDEDIGSDHEGSAEENYEESSNQFDEIDTNGDGPKGDVKPQVTYSDGSDDAEVISKEEYPELFDKIDTNGDGHLDKHELKVFFETNDANVLLAGKVEGAQIAKDDGAQGMEKWEWVTDSEDGEEGEDWEWVYYTNSTTNSISEDIDDYYNSTDDYNSTNDDLDDEYEWEYYTEESASEDGESSTKGLRGTSGGASSDDVEVEEVIQLDMFHDMDTNADNAIDKQEYMDFYADMGMEMAQADIDEIFSLQDLDGDGVISWDEYQGPKGETEQDT